MIIKVPLWQRVFCGLLALGGAVALVRELSSGGLHNSWATVEWLFAACGAFMFATIALARGTECRAVELLPAPSAQVGNLVAAHQMLDAIKVYRTEANATFLEAKTVMLHYWPGSSFKRMR